MPRVWHRSIALDWCNIRSSPRKRGPRFWIRAFAGLSGRGALTRAGCALTFVGAVAAPVLGAATPLRAQTASALPPGEGRDLVATACSQCHTLNVIMAGRDGPVGWKKHVYNMVLRGAQLTPREADTVIQYLITNFGPGAPAAAAAALPSGPGKELVETRCTVSARVSPTRGTAAAVQLAQTSAYLVAQFGRD